MPPILDACLVVGELDVTQGARLASFLADRPANADQAQHRPEDHGLCRGLKPSGRVWEGNSKVAKPVKDAIKAKR